MFSNWTVGKRLIAGFGLAALTLATIVIVSYRNARLLIENDAWVAHSHQVRTELADLLSQLKDAETGQRGYLITGSDGYLEPYQAAVAAIKLTLADVKNIAADNPNQQRRLAAISSLIDSKIEELKETVDLRRTQGFDAALKVVLTNAGKTLMDQIRTIIIEADQEEKELLKRRSEEARASADMTMMIILWGGLLGTVVVGAIGWFITSSLSDQIGSAVGQVRSSSTELQAAANQQARRRQGTGRRHDRDLHHHQRASRDIAADHRKRAARRAERRADRERRSLRSRHRRHDSRLDHRHPPPGRSNRRSHARIGQEIAGNRRRARHRLRTC
jgi:CHASE3 domain sensor protein